MNDQGSVSPVLLGAKTGRCVNPSDTFIWENKLNLMAAFKKWSEIS